VFIAKCLTNVSLLYLQVIVVLALIAFASAQFLYSGGVSGPSFHNAYAASANTAIRRYGSTAGIIAAPAYAAYY